MIVDTSAIVAMILKEPEGPVFAARIAADRTNRMSVVSFVEVSIVLSRREGEAGLLEFRELVRNLGISVDPVTVEQCDLAVAAFQNFGRGNHPARLNFGDCFTYALAKSTGEPVLFKGDDFSRTDLTAALPGPTAPRPPG